LAKTNLALIAFPGINMCFFSQRLFHCVVELKI